LEKEYWNTNNQGEISVYVFKGDVSYDWLESNPINSQVFPDKWIYQQHPFRLKILHFNDLHGHLSRFELTKNSPVFSRMVSHIQQVRSECEDDPFAGVLVFSAGDDCIGSPYDLLLRDDQGDYKQHASYHVFAKAGINAVVPGNHDFDFGLKFLAKAVQTEGNFPVLVGNLKINNEINSAFAQAAIFSIKGIRVGVIGITTPAVSPSRKNLEYEIDDPVKVVKALLPIVRSNSDLVIILSHLGNNLQSTTAPTAIAGDVELANELPYASVDLIIGGHTHDVLNQEKLDQGNVVNGIPITQAGSHGQFLGEVEFIWRDRFALNKVRLIPVEKIPVERDFENYIIQPIIKKLHSYSQKKIGVVEKNEFLMDEYQNKYQPGRESASFNFLTDNLVECSKSIGFPVDLAVIDTTGFRQLIQPGNSISYIDLWRMLPYENTLVLIRMTGDVLIDLIRLNVQQCRWPNRTQSEPMVLHFSREIRYQIYQNDENSELEVKNIRFNANPMNDCSHEYSLASSSYFLSVLKLWQHQSDEMQKKMEEILKNIKIEDTGWLIRDLMIERIHQWGGINVMGGAQIDGRIKWVKNSLKGF
jgi:2',3'-cyclic-nucleotide 2'-phosphodiesterase (5'-nucleotidase family)